LSAAEANADAAAEARVNTALDHALAALTPDDRALLHEKYFSGASVRDLAEKRSVSVKAAESRLTRARAELRNHLLAALRSHETET